MLLTDKYTDRIYGTITCYDRMIIQGYIPGWSHAEGMTSYLNANSIRIFDFSNFSQPLTEQIRANASVSQRKMALKLNSSASCGLSVRMTGFRILSTRPGRLKVWSTSFLPWNSAILISHGMIRLQGRHSLSLTKANVSTIISISLTKNWACVTCASLPGRLSVCSFI